MLTHVLETPVQGAAPGAAQRRGLPGAPTSEHYGRPALSTRGLREKNLQTPPRLSFPQQPWGATSPGRPWWSQAGPRQEFPPKALCHPPNLGSMFTFSFECQQRGALQEAPVGAGGALGRVLSTVPCPPLHGREEGLPGQAGPQSRHYGCLTGRLTEDACGLFRL